MKCPCDVRTSLLCRAISGELGDRKVVKASLESLIVGEKY
jgi:hypothetical protein